MSTQDISSAKKTEQYLILERMMMEADEQGDEPFAESLRDVMDFIWYRLSDVDLARLNGRRKNE